MFHQSKEWGQRPSEILRITNDYDAWCLDEVVWYLGNYVEAEVAQAGRSLGKSDNEKLRRGRSENRLRQLLGVKQEFASLG